ncbi:MAG: hypothetical protein ACRCXC_10775 [Legionella sp.]
MARIIIRSSSVLEILERLKKRNFEVIVHEPTLNAPEFYQAKVVNDLAAFKNEATLIIANRKSTELADVTHKVFPRDLFGSD